MTSMYTILLWIFLNIMVSITVMLAMFSQLTMHKSSIYDKILTTEFWATIEWFCVVPMQRIGYTFLNPAQLALSSYFFQFLGQLFSNNFWLKINTTIDDYIGMLLIIIGMIISKFVLLG